jgi:hypothetical protein
MNIGDLVELKPKHINAAFYHSGEWEITANYGGYEFAGKVKPNVFDLRSVEEKTKQLTLVKEEDLILVFKYSKNKSMKITNLTKKLLDGNTRKLIRAGFIDGELALTDEGVDELLGLFFIEKKDELVKIAEEKIADEKN